MLLLRLLDITLQPPVRVPVAVSDSKSKVISSHCSLSSCTDMLVPPPSPHFTRLRGVARGSAAAPGLHIAAVLTTYPPALPCQAPGAVVWARMLAALVLVPVLCEDADGCSFCLQALASISGADSLEVR